MDQGCELADSTVSVELIRQAVKDAPPYDPAAGLDRNQEMGVHEHYGHAKYWETDANRVTETSHH